MQFKQFTEKEITNIYNQLYIHQGKGLRKISKEIGIGDNRLRNLFKSLGLRIKNGGECTGSQLSLVNENCFNSWSKEMAYWLGFIAADGSIVKNRNAIYIKLIHEDRYHLQKFLNFIESKNVSIKDYDMKYQNGTRLMSYISISNKYIKEALLNYGIKPDKSHLNIDFLKYIPINYKESFIIGYFDGDGSVMPVKQDNRFLINFTGNEKFLTSIKTYLINNHNFNDVKVIKSKNSNCYQIAWGSKNDLLKFRNIYINTISHKILLERKLLIFQSDNYSAFINKNSNTERVTTVTNNQKIKQSNKTQKCIKRCIKCGKNLAIYHNSKTNFCKVCYLTDGILNKRKVERPSKEKLIEFISNIPFTKIAAEFGVSDNSIRKWCKYYNLPYRKIEIIEYINKNK